MARGKRRAAAIAGQREARAIAANLGRDLRLTRGRRQLTQAALGELVDRSQSEVSYLERGYGGRATLETWISFGIALERPVAIGFSRDVIAPLNDAGHLEAQELVLRLATAGGWRGSFEVQSEGSHSMDLVLERGSSRVLVELWNRLDDLGAAVRSSDRKLTAAAPGTGLLWLLVDTAANRAIVRRFPAIFRSRFPASSAGWVRAVANTEPMPPNEPGIAWVDIRAGALRTMRTRG